ncbi:hydrolase, alpha/beta hydrolase fold family [Metarhizium album ARSEF 1941]|uniref:Hydrolase, alpha/beta hydrolase fold family n=1 Tax=Metarhizium album (strain ARSEF 1941) TaxID=1081103 RepID=A0A0B2WSX8_METAS|nr:hydrolase, alpha/beta hydrolase fold family [Metarhizium album ARSEF 1941]KHN96065.1 hydrolase, alpha/beta hydrolase fold family [Metarhizium album ARSEF 1941]
MDHWDPALINPLAARRPVVLIDDAGVGRSRGDLFRLGRELRRRDGGDGDPASPCDGLLHGRTCRTGACSQRSLARARPGSLWHRAEHWRWCCKGTARALQPA